MAGITRIRINSNWQDWRTEMAIELAPMADDIYREAFASIGMPLASGVADIDCTKQEALSRYDWKEGVDLIFRFEAGNKATAQEKFLTYYESTLTVEETKTSGKPGAWYYCTAQYYFIGYARQWSTYNRPEAEWPKMPVFHDWILTSFPALQRADARGLVPWLFNGNKRDGRRARFRYVNFKDIPGDCIIATAQPVFQSAF